jgi:gliding motility-associated-like protein
MKIKLLRLIFEFVFLVGLGSQRLSAQTYSWAVKAAGTGAENTRGIATDAQQNVYHYFYYTGSVVIDSAGTPITITSNGGKDLAIVKYNCNKQFQWVVKIGGPYQDGGDFNNAGIAIDSLGNIFASGSYRVQLFVTSANGTTITRGTTGPVSAIDNAFILKMTNSGIVQWVNTVISTGDDEAGGVSADREGNVYFTGFHSNNALFTSTSGTTNSTLISAGSTDIFIVKYSNEGEILVSNRGGGNFQDLGASIATDSLENMYVAGQFGFGGTGVIALGNNISNNGAWGAFVSKADPNGTWIWANAMGQAASEAYSNVVVDDLNNRVYVTGHYNGNSQVTSRPGGTFVNVTTNGQFDAIVVCMNLDGANQWARTMGSAANEFGYGLTLDANLNVMFSGEFSGTIALGALNITSSGNSSGYIGRISRLNVPLNLYKIGTTSPGFRAASVLHTGSSGKVYVGGYYISAPVYFSNDTLVGAGGEDGFLAKINENDTTFLRSTATTIQCTADTAYLYIPNKVFGTYRWLRNDTLITITSDNRFKTNIGGTYKVVSVSPCEPNDTSIAITVNKLTTFVTPRLGDKTICRFDSTQLGGNPIYNYAWTPGSGLRDSMAANPWTLPLSNTTYFATISSQGCTASDTVVISVNQNCCITCSTPYDINQGLVACYPFNGNANDESGNGNNGTVTGATLTADRFGVANRAYLFGGFNNFINVPNSASLASPTTEVTIAFWGRINGFYAFNPTTIFASAVTKGSSTTNYQYRFAVKNNGILSFNNNRQWNFTVGTNTNLATWYHFAVTMKDTLMIYYRNGLPVGSSTVTSPITSARNENLRIGRGNPTNAADQFNGILDDVKIWNRALSGAEIYKLYSLSSINGLPTVNAGIDKNMCKDDSVFINATGTGIANFLWTPNRSLMTDSTALIIRTWPADTTTFILRGDVSGCKNYDTINVNVIDFKPEAGLPQNICFGDSVQLNASPALLYQWSPNLYISNINISNPWVKPDTTTRYFLTANNGLCTRFDTVDINVTRVYLDPIRDTTMCLDDSVQIAINTTGILSYLPVTGISDTTISNPYVKVASNTSYIVTSTLFGCSVRDTFEANTSLLNLDAGPNREICIFDSIQLNAVASTGADYRWSPNYFIEDTAISNPWVRPQITTVYYLKSQNGYCTKYDSAVVIVNRPIANAGSDKIMCLGDTIRFNGTSNGITNWSPSTGIIDTGAIARLTPLVTTDYVMTVTQGICTATDTVNVQVLNLTVDAGTNQKICLGDSAQLTATGALKYNWFPLYAINDTGIANPKVAPIIKTTYYAIVTNGYCFRFDSVEVDVQSVNAQAGLDTSVCEGEAVRLSASGGTNYVWTPATGADNPNISNPLVTPTRSGTWVVKVSDALGCSDYDSLDIKIHAYPTIEAGPDLKHCPDDIVQINATGKDYTSIIWTPATGLNNRLSLTPFASVSSNTTYVLTARNYQCAKYDTVTVTLPPPISAAFDLSTNQGNAPLLIQFTNNSLNAHFYTWTFGPIGASSTLKDPAYTYTEKGFFTVKLTVEDSTGCIDTISKTVNVDIIASLFAPNAFTPNNDGDNDVFAFTYTASEFEYLEYRVFNRWGVEIFATRMPGGQWWNGTDGTNPAPPDTYTYVMSAKDKYGKKYKLTGSIFLMR